MAAWVAMQIPHVAGFGFGPCTAIGVATENEPVAGIVFHDWQERAQTLQCSMAATTPRWAAKGILRALFFYAFETAGANKLWTATPHTSHRVIKFNRGIGLKPEATLRHHFGPKRHAVICSILRSEWERGPFAMKADTHG